MRKFWFDVVGNRFIHKEFARPCALVSLLCAMVFFCAFSGGSTTTPGIAHRRIQRGHPSSTQHIVRRSTGKRKVRPTVRKTSLSAQRSALRGRQRRKRITRAQRYRLTATLDNVRTHARPAEMERNSREDVPPAPGDHPEVPQPLALVVPGTTPGAVDSTALAQPVSQSNSSLQDVSARDLPAFNLSVPSFMPLALRGSHEVLIHQNIIADVEGLSRIRNDAQLREMVHTGDLVALPASSALFVDSRLPLNRRYCRPWTAKFLTDLSRAHQTVFGRPLQLTSAVRTMDFQRHLARYNGNAAPAYGETASPHLTGQAIDLGKKGMSQHEIAWMRTILGQLQNSGRLDVEEEFEQACFHISVYKTYAPHSAGPVRLVAENNGAAAEEVVTKPAIGALAPSAPVRSVRAATEPVRAHSYSTHVSRRVAAHRRRRRHHAGMALLAVRMR